MANAVLWTLYHILIGFVIGVVTVGIVAQLYAEQQWNAGWEAHKMAAQCIEQAPLHGEKV